MTIGELIYTILIGPLELLFEVIFVIADRHVSNPAYAIIALSLAMNFLVLPLYRRADAVQAEERDRENKLAPWIKHIKQTFKGDERFMMLQAYYKENNYKPTDSLKGSISLLLEIPFFIAAYHFLSNLQTLRGITFGPISDLGAPDALLSIGGTTFNLLPILMTLINVISAAIYMKGFPLKSKIQMYGIAAIFLIFLYKSPAGLVFYWTLNNLFSLIKNIFYKLPNPEKILKILCSITGIILLFLVIFVHPMPSRRAQAIVVAAILCMQVPLFPKREWRFLDKIDSKEAAIIFYASCLFLTLITGLLIPSAVISDSAQEFINITNWHSPYWYIVSALAIAIGTFFVWFGIFYRLASPDGRKLFSILMTIAVAVAVTDYMFFGKNYGNMSSTLTFDSQPEIGMKRMLVNAAVIAIVAIAVAFVFIKNTAIIKALSVAMSLALIVMSGINIANIQEVLSEASSTIKAAVESEPEIKLSKNGKNVIVLMMDRQIGHFIPFIMHEKPELKDSFKGFTNYANSFSYGYSTNIASSALFGGYEYTPSGLNNRPEMKLVEKHNESLKVMPKMFSEEGYEVTVLDPTYAGYSWIPDLTIYDDIPNVHAAITNGRYSYDELNYETDEEKSIELRNRNFFLYGLFKVAPLVAQPTIYEKGNYNKSEGGNLKMPQAMDDFYTARGVNKPFMATYPVLCNLPNITNISKENKNNFIMMSNDTTHEAILLQEPAFEPAANVDNSAIPSDEYLKRKDDNGNVIKFEKDIAITHYQTNVATMLKIGEWLDYLKKEGVYDNTRIIIVSDHGRNIGDGMLPMIEYKNVEGEDAIIDACFYDCVLMVKDFDSSELETNNDLASNADTVWFATQGLIEDPRNPYTGNKIRRLEKGEKGLIYHGSWKVEDNKGNTFKPGPWFQIEDNIYKKENWKDTGIH